MVLRSTIGLYGDEAYGAMMNYGGKENDIDDNGNKDRNYDNNATSGSGSDASDLRSDHDALISWRRIG